MSDHEKCPCSNLAIAPSLHERLHDGSPESNTLRTQVRDFASLLHGDMPAAALVRVKGIDCVAIGQRHGERGFEIQFLAITGEATKLAEGLQFYEADGSLETAPEPIRRSEMAARVATEDRGDKSLRQQIAEACENGTLLELADKLGKPRGDIIKLTRDFASHLKGRARDMFLAQARRSGIYLDDDLTDLSDVSASAARH